MQVVIPADAGIQNSALKYRWIPACAGMTDTERATCMFPVENLSPLAEVCAV